jgi:hypothetical protein
MRFKLIAAFAAIYFISGSTYVAIKYAIAAIPPFLMMGARSLAAGICLLFVPWEKLDAHRSDYVSACAIVFGALSWPSGAVYSRAAKLPKSPVLAAGLELVVGGLLLIACGLFMGEASRLQLHELPVRSLLGLSDLTI